MNDGSSLFRQEARELVDGLSRELLALEKAPDDKNAYAACLRLAHTLKGTARMVRQLDIAERAHTLEDALLPLRDSGEAVEKEYFGDLLMLVDRIREVIDQISTSGAEEEEPASTVTRASAEGEALETLRVDISEMDQLLEGLAEAAIQLDPLRNVHDSLRQTVQTVTSLQESVRSGKGADHALLLGRVRTTVDALRSALVNVEQMMGPSLSKLEREIEGVRERASTLRLLPVSAILGTLERVARDTAASMGKSVTFTVTGADAKLEGQILLSVREALLHVIRNAVDHGIEPAPERLAAGKPAAGRVLLDVVRKGRRVEFRFRDDGRGIDAEKVRRAAVKNGRLTKAQAEALAPAELYPLLFETGFSTADAVTEISGRGVGLDVVRAVAERLRGQATLHSEPGRGTIMTIDVPMSLSAMTVLSVAVSGSTVLIPLHAVLRTLRASPGDVVRNSDGDCLVHEGRAIPFVPIDALLGAPRPSAEPRRAWTVIVVSSGSSSLALGADGVFETIDIVVKPLPAGVDAPRAIAGAAFDCQGDPLLVLDPMGLEGVRGEATKADEGPREARAPRLPILVIDDSLTTRMLEQSILEAAGYTVDLCASAEDALKRAQTRKYCLFIVDVEMPGMNGYEFTRATRADPTLNTVPVIMVTSLAAAHDRQRGLDAGASEYIVKGDFDQKHFLRKVAELLGAG